MGASDVRAGGAFVELFAEDSKLRAALKRAQLAIASFGAEAIKIGASLDLIGGSITGGITYAANLFAEAGSKVFDVTQRVGVSAEAYSELAFALEQAGGKAEDLEVSFRKMLVLISDAASGSSSAAQALSRLGLSAEKLKGLSVEDQFSAIAEAISKLSSPADRAAAAIDVFGRGGTKLLPLLADGARGVEAFRKATRELGLTITGEQATAADALGDAWATAWAQVRKVVFEVGAAVAPVFTAIAERIQPIVASVIRLVQENQGLVVTALAVGAGILAVGAVITGIGVAAIGASIAIGALSAAIGIVGSIVAALISPIGLAVTAVVALAAGGLYAAEVYSGAVSSTIAGVMEVFEDLADVAKSTVGGISDALSAGDVQLAAQILWAGLKAAWQTGTADIKIIWTGFVYDLAGAFDVISTGAESLFDNLTTGIADIIGKVASVTGLDQLVLGVSLDESELEQFSQQLESQQKDRDAKRERELTERIATLQAAKDAEVAGINDDLERAKKDLAALRDEAAKKDTENRERKAREAAKPRVAPEFEFKPPETAVAAQQRLESGSFGTFAARSGASFAGVGIGKLVAVAEATKRNTDALPRIDRKLDDIQPEFG